MPAIPSCDLWQRALVRPLVSTNQQQANTAPQRTKALQSSQCRERVGLNFSSWESLMMSNRFSGLYSGKNAVFCLALLGCLAMVQANVNGNPSWYQPPSNWEQDNDHARSPSIGTTTSSGEQQSSEDEVTYFPLFALCAIYLVI